MLSRLRKIFTPFSVTLLIFILFTVIYCLISLVNHYQFRTYAADLGIFEHAMYSFSRFRADYITLHLYSENPSFLGDHFSPLVMLFVPFYWLFGSYGLLILQILAVGAGAAAVYKCVQHFSKWTWLPVLISLQYFSILSIYSSLAYDFHTNVVAAGLFPWLIYFYFKEKRQWVLLLFFIIIIAKETMPIWMAFVFTGLMLMKRRNVKDYLRFEIPVIVFSLIYFYLVVNNIMPSLREGKGTDQMRLYASLGDGIPGIIRNLFTKPGVFIEALYKSNSTDPQFDHVKTEFHLMVLFSGGLALLLRPQWLIMLIPLYAQKMLSDNPGLWGINNHYSIEFVPVLCLATADLLSRIPRKQVVYSLAGLQALLTMGYTATKLEDRQHEWYDRVNNQFYTCEHYDSMLNLKAVYEILDNIPDDIALSVSPELSPHLASRDKIYCFPVVRDAEMIVIFSAKRGDYPLNRVERKKFIVELENRKEFRRVLDRDDIIILKRIK
ncbi:MAG: DUF2079 domain-containing protein [Bacteroidales bacterium]